MNVKNILLHGSLAGTIALAICASPAFAMQAPNKEAGAVESDESGEIVVTATKRAERILDVPISVAAISGESLENRGAKGMDDYLAGVPGVSFQERSAVENAIVIRGIETSPQAQNFGAGTTVATYFGETPTTTSAGLLGGAGLDLKLVDIERVEVLRGPQGTSFGNSSLGGAVRTIPKAPNVGQFEGSISGTVSQTAKRGSTNTMISGVVNIPLVKDRMAVRAVAYRIDDSGYYANNAATDPTLQAYAATLGAEAQSRAVSLKDRGATVIEGARIAVGFQPGSTVDVTFSYAIQKAEQDGFAYSMTGGNYTYAQFSVRPEYANRPGDGVFDSQLQIANATANVDLDWAVLTGSLSKINSWSLRTQGGQAGRAYGFRQYANHDGLTGELRLASKLDGPFQFLGGVYYEKLDDVGNEDYFSTGSAALSPVGDKVNVLAGVYDTYRTQKQIAGFGELTYNITDTLSVLVGGRAYNYDKSNRSESSGWFAGRSLTNPNISDTSISKSGQTFKASVSYKPDSNTHLYASWAEGFRLGRPAVGLLPAVCDVNNDGTVDGTNISIASTREIASDTTETYEIGAKLRRFNGGLSIDAAAYKTNWNGVPTNARVQCGSASYFYVANAGAAESQGVEVQTSIRVADNFRIDAGASYVDAELATDVPTLNAVKGDRLPGSPKWNANLGAQFDFPLGDWEAFIRGDSIYRSTFYGDLAESPLTKAGGYMKIDLRAGFKREHLKVEIFANNITGVDKYVWRGLTNNNAGFGYVMRPRTIGARAMIDF
ncbi:TonB-dependent receptor [Sphingopyxis kveilinensis]|uniref:TonB-dependent receptor n=1 Tax=Sphingopyxis kveilinensis TaxID=3114367 RepID=UPI0030D0154E